MSRSTTEPIDVWVTRKLERRTWSLREPRTTSALHKRPLGPKGEYAGVTMSAAPAASFAFVSRAIWPAQSNYEDAVLEAALDVLLCSGPHRPTGVRLTLDEIRWHDVDSCAVAFYWAARAAVTELAGLDRFGYPTNFAPVAR